jgi:hypothetical protein
VWFALVLDSPDWLPVKDELEDDSPDWLPVKDELEDADELELEELELEALELEALELEDELDEDDELDDELDDPPSVQLSEKVLLDEIAVTLSAFTANTPRMPPVETVNGLVTLIVQLTFVPTAKPPTASVASFFLTLSAGLAFEPPFGTR